MRLGVVMMIAAVAAAAGSSIQLGQTTVQPASVAQGDAIDVSAILQNSSTEDWAGSRYQVQVELLSAEGILVRKSSPLTVHSPIASGESKTLNIKGVKISPPLMGACSLRVLVLEDGKIVAKGKRSSLNVADVAQNPGVELASDLRNTENLTKTALEATGKGGIQWVTIPGGAFTMGSDQAYLTSSRPTHLVTVKSFQIAKTLVTNKQYRACVAARACAPVTSSDPSFDGDDQPVVNVDWGNAVVYSRWVGGRLPSEAEWEYAARGAGKDQKSPWGNGDASCSIAVVRGCASVTSPVCSKPAGNTEQGLCDMVGNVWEWVEDLFHDSYAGAPTDGRAWEDTGSERSVRGGSSYSNGGDLDAALSALRSSYDPGYRAPNLGFRPVKGGATPAMVPIVVNDSDVLGIVIRMLSKYGRDKRLSEGELNDAIEQFIHQKNPEATVRPTGVQKAGRDIVMQWGVDAKSLPRSDANLRAVSFGGVETETTSHEAGYTDADGNWVPFGMGGAQVIDSVQSQWVILSFAVNLETKRVVGENALGKDFLNFLRDK